MGLDLKNAVSMATPFIPKSISSKADQFLNAGEQALSIFNGSTDSSSIMDKAIGLSDTFGGNMPGNSANSSASNVNLDPESSKVVQDFEKMLDKAEKAATGKGAKKAKGKGGEDPKAQIAEARKMIANVKAALASGQLAPSDKNDILKQLKDGIKAGNAKPKKKFPANIPVIGGALEFIGKGLSKVMGPVNSIMAKLGPVGGALASLTPAGGFLKIAQAATGLMNGEGLSSLAKLIPGGAGELISKGMGVINGFKNGGLMGGLKAGTASFAPPGMADTLDKVTNGIDAVKNGDFMGAVSMIPGAEQYTDKIQSVMQNPMSLIGDITA